VIASPWEAQNAANVLLPQSGALALGLALVLAALFARTLVVKLPALLANAAIDGMWRWLAGVPAALALFICWMIPWNPALMTLGRAQAVMLAMTAMIPLVAWLLYHIAWRVMSSVAEAARLRQEVELLGMEERRFRDLQGYVAETRALRHDFRHHLLAMSGMLDEGHTNELASYLGQLAHAEELGQRPRFCENAAVDAVAAHYDAAARRRGVRVEWRLALPDALPIPEVDLCSILGNLVENAINASCELPEEMRWVEAASREVTPAALGIVVRNPCEGPVAFGEDGLPTTEEPGHGVGLASVAATAQRYHGGIDAHVEGDVFSVGVILYHA
jgi:C4-dicarboxylate-specific signal transduction histidine kinase